MNPKTSARLCWESSAVMPSPVCRSSTNSNHSPESTLLPTFSCSFRLEQPSLSPTEHPRGSRALCIKRSLAATLQLKPSKSPALCSVQQHWLDIPITMMFNTAFGLDSLGSVEWVLCGFTIILFRTRVQLAQSDQPTRHPIQHSAGTPLCSPVHSLRTARLELIEAAPWQRLTLSYLKIIDKLSQPQRSKSKITTISYGKPIRL